MNPVEQEADELQETEVDLDEHISKMITVRKKVLGNITKAQEWQKWQYDEKYSQL